MPPISANNEIGAHVEMPARDLGLETDDPIAIPEEVLDLCPHLELEARVELGVIGEEIEEVPLRDKDDEAAARGEVGEIGEDDLVVADDSADLAHLGMRQLEERIEQAELVHDLQRRGMNGVTAEVAQEIGVLLEHEHIDAGAREQEAEHHPGRPASGDRAARRDLGHSLDLYDGHLNLFQRAETAFRSVVNAHSVVVMPATAGTPYPLSFQNNLPSEITGDENGLCVPIRRRPPWPPGGATDRRSAGSSRSMDSPDPAHRSRW